MSTIDLSQLPLPDVIESLDFEVIFSARKARLIGLYPVNQRADIAKTLELESEPLTKLLQESAYLEMILRSRINDAAQASMLVRARSADLDNRAAEYSVFRLLITPEDLNANPPIAAIWESDDRLRMRALMSLEGLSVAGPRGAYIFHTLSASPLVADVNLAEPVNGLVQIAIMSTASNGIANTALCNIVQSALSSENVRPLCDTVSVKSGKEKSFVIDATIEFDDITQAGGLSNLLQRLNTMLQEKKKLNAVISRSAFDAALHIPGVRRVTLTSPAADIVCAWDEFPLATRITVT